MMKRLRVLLLGGAAALLAGTALAEGDVRRVNGTIRIEAGQSAGDLATVNGSIRVESDATVGDIETINGEIDLGARATAGSVSAVNGEIDIEAGARVGGSVKAVNGEVSLGRGSDVGAEVATVNGEIDVDGARIGGRLETVSGDIDVRAGSRIEGGLLVERPRGSGYSSRPRIVIGPDAVVEGTLRFEREVDLYVSDRATVGTIEGATAVSFSGDSP